MDELYDIWETADSLDELPDVPGLDEFEACFETIDVGYDCFVADAYVLGPYALVYDEERFRRDTWGWSANISYIDENGRISRLTPALKCGGPEEALDRLQEYVSELN